jgi:hypothetical protein
MKKFIYIASFACVFIVAIIFLTVLHSEQTEEETSQSSTTESSTFQITEPVPSKPIVIPKETTVDLVMEDVDKRVVKKFLSKLKQCKQGPVRVVHYGDSQIEGDRITAIFRNNMQRRYGGGGPGMMTLVKRVNSLTYKQITYKSQQEVTKADRIVNYTAFLFKKQRDNDLYGPMGQVFVMDNDRVEGVVFWAGDQSVSLGTVNGVPEVYALRVEVTDGTLTFGLKTDCATANWVAMDNLFLLWAGNEANYYAQASAEQPVRVPLTNPRMENNLDGWTLNDYWQKQGATYANFDPDFMECWTGHGENLSNRSVTQTVNLKDGNYKLAAAVNAVQQGNTSLTVQGVTMRLGNKSVACHTGDGQPEVFSTKAATYKSGATTLGLYITNTNANWVAWDNVVLYCYGITGDINTDGKVDTADVRALSEYIVGKSANNSGFNRAAADVNADGRVSIADVTALINKIRGE